MVWKTVTPSFTGDTQHFGGVDINKYANLFNGVLDVDSVDINSNFTFRSGKNKIRNPANTFSYIITSSPILGDYNLLLPAITGNDTVAVLGLSQIFSAAKTFDTHIDVKQIAAPGSPGVPYHRLYVDIADGHLKRKNSAGTISDLETGGGGGTGEANTASNIGAGGVGVFVQKSVFDLQFKNINTTSAYLTVTDDPVNNEIDLDVGVNVAKLNVAQTFTSTHTFNSGALSLRNPANTFSYNFVAGAITADRTLNLPVITGTDTVGVLGLAQTFTAVKTFDTYTEIKQVSAPANPASTYHRLYVDSSDGHLKKKTSAGVVTDYDTASGITVSTTGIKRPTLYIPLYIFPSPTSAWQPIADAKLANPELDVIAVMNPNNGVFSSRDSSFGAGLVLLDNAGVRVVGYVYTSYGARAAATVKGDIDNYATYYPEVRGIMFDEFQGGSGTGFEAYYQDLNSYVHVTKKMDLTIGNPGAPVAASYIGTMDNLIIYEIAGIPSLGTLNTATLNGAFDKNNFGLTPYNVASITTYGVRALLDYVGLIYLQSDNLPNPWDSITSYIAQLAKIVGSAKGSWD